MKWNFREVRKIRDESLRALCIKNDWYTRGNIEEYEHLLFDLADDKENVTTDDICEIAQDIIYHSEGLLAEDFEHVAFEVLQIATTWLEEI